MKLTQISRLSGRTGETAAAGQPHTGGLRQREDRQERQLLQICMNRHDRYHHLHGDHIQKMCFLFLRVNSSASILTWQGTSSVPTSRPVSFSIASTHPKHLFTPHLWTEADAFILTLLVVCNAKMWQRWETVPEKLGLQVLSKKGHDSKTNRPPWKIPSHPPGQRRADVSRLLPDAVWNVWGVKGCDNKTTANVVHSKL